MCGRLPRRLLILAAFGVFTIAGCGSAEVDPAAPANLKGLAGLYADYAQAHQNPLNPHTTNNLRPQ